MNAHLQHVLDTLQQIGDISDEQKAAQDQLVQQEKLASLGQLTAGIAHEIKNPLNFVNNFSELSVELIEEAREEVKGQKEKGKGDSERSREPRGEKSPFEGGAGAKAEVGDVTESSYHPKLTVRTKSEDSSVTIEIEDNGPGIPEEMKDKILQPFFTTKKETQGTGLGLSITNDIIKAHGGGISIESKQGEGTTFTFSL